MSTAVNFRRQLRRSRCCCFPLSVALTLFMGNKQKLLEPPMKPAICALAVRRPARCAACRGGMRSRPQLYGQLIKIKGHVFWPTTFDMQICRVPLANFNTISEQQPAQRAALRPVVQRATHPVVQRVVQRGYDFDAIPQILFEKREKETGKRNILKRKRKNVRTLRAC